MLAIVREPSALDVSTLSTTTLIATLIRSRMLSVARTRVQGLLQSLSGLEVLPEYGFSDFVGFGLRPSEACRLAAALELARRIAREPLDKLPCSDPASIARYVALTYAKASQEVMGALFLDLQHCLLDEKEIFRGGIRRAFVEPRPILKRALLIGAASVVLFHTHPSGDSAPSPQDLSFTERMSEAGALVGVRLLDHLIVGSATSWVSLRERGLLRGVA